MTYPLISCVVIVKNGERYLASALQSILDQDYRPIEMIVVDGQSSDRTAEIAGSYPGVRFIVQQKPGTAEAYNLGIQTASGEFVAFLSHDDMWTSDKLTTQVTYMMQNPELQYTISRTEFFLEEGCSVPARFKVNLLQGDYVLYGMETLVARKQLFEEIGGLNPEFRIANDTEWFKRAMDLKVKMSIIQKVLLRKRIHESITTIYSSELTRDLLNIARRSLSRQKQV
jgi:glycosyltransferase involved in cell wall biosynthesis